jgi:hemerythrin HHE cation binding domain-containing protein
MAMDETRTTPHADPEHDILSILVNDNLGLDELLVMLDRATEVAPRRRLVALLRGELDLHFTIERSCLMPLVNEARSYGAWTPAEALRQQQDIETATEALSAADIERTEFDQARDDLAGKVRRYIRYEEDELFAALRPLTTVDDLNQAGRRAAAAKSAAEPRPPLPDI